VISRARKRQTGTAQVRVAAGGTAEYSTPGAVLVVAVWVAHGIGDATIVNSRCQASPTLSGSSFQSVSWILKAYKFVSPRFSSKGGQLEDLLGRRRVVSSALVMFHAGSALCDGWRPPEYLIAARAVAGRGRPPRMVPSSLGDRVEAYPAHRRIARGRAVVGCRQPSRRIAGRPAPAGC